MPVCHPCDTSANTMTVTAVSVVAYLQAAR